MNDKTQKNYITYEQVAAAADAFSANNLTPTLRKVRESLGSGSLGTIQKHLASWQDQKRQIVTSTVTLPTEIQRVIIERIEQQVNETKSALESEIASTKEDRDTLADENEKQAAIIDSLNDSIIKLEENSQQQQFKIEQLTVDVESFKSTADKERLAAESSRTLLAKAELRLESLPRLEAELDKLRSAIDDVNKRAAAAEQAAAVATAEAKAADRRATELEAREKEAQKVAADALASEKQSRSSAESARIAEQAAQARIESSAREVEAANKAAAKAREESKKAIEEAAELRGKLAASIAKKE